MIHFDLYGGSRRYVAAERGRAHTSSVKVSS